MTVTSETRSVAGRVTALYRRAGSAGQSRLGFGLLLSGGRVGDILGRRRVLTVGLVLFSAASLLGGVAQDRVWLLAARAAQGVGAALIAPAALALIVANFPEGPQRSRATSVYASVSALAS